MHHRAAVDKSRGRLYQRSTAPLVEFYKKLGMITPVSAVGSVEEVYARTIAALQTRG